MATTKLEASKEKAAFYKKLRKRCLCGRTFAEHGARPPHTHGDDCPGFRPRATTA